MEPIDTRNASAAVHAYGGSLQWPLTVGFRRRPRQGCTCGNRNCPDPGGHPLPGRPLFHSVEETLQELEAAPGAALIAWTRTFDVVVVSRPVGMAAMVTLDQVAPVPCLVADRYVALFVLPATGRYALGGGLPGEVRSGASGWIAVPPSHGVRWDTQPWVEQTSRPVGLLNGATVGQHLASAYTGQELVVGA
ncbi:hypothetical protein [Streptomyces sp. NPDC007346]|uniref:hypothetical protein n=1 Tax=Streptomyces sp. NPDC007346 TaxID=3154682 RepID=UPI00345355B9